MSAHSQNPSRPTLVLRIGRHRLTLSLRPRRRIAALLAGLLTRCWRALPGLAGLAATGGALAAGPVAPNALPSGGTVSFGQAGIVQNGSQLTIRQGSDKAILNWNSFNIGAQASVVFQQPGANSVVLNRVSSNEPSQLLGNLSANGKVWIINPAGIMVGQGAQINLQSLVASSLAIRDEDFLAGRMNFQATPNAGQVRNLGSITTPAGGSVYLIAPQVENGGVIRAPNGEVILAAGQRVELLDTATPGVKVEISGAEGQATNLGQVISEAGRIGMAGVLVRNSGRLSADSAVSEGGRIFLRASKDAVIDGTAGIGVTGTRGGQVEVTGERVGLLGSARIDASGVNGGGTVLLGGDYQGGNSAVRNAQTAVLAPDAVIKADATGQGHGGKVIVWSDGVTIAAGSISATGGAQGGDGGLIETSGKRFLNVDSLRADTSAARGAHGILLLDPDNITIGTVALFDGASTGADLNTVGLSGGAYTLDTNSFAGYSSQITAAKVGQLLGVANVVLLASGDITVQNAIAKTTGATQTLTLTAGQNVYFNANVTSTSGALNLNATAGSGISGGGTLNLNGGALNLTTSNGDISLGQINAGSLAMTASNGQLIVDSGTDWRANSFNLIAGSHIRGSAGVANLGSTGGGATITAQTGGSGAIAIAHSGDLATLNLTAPGSIEFASDGVVASAQFNTSGNVTASAASLVLAGPLEANHISLTGHNGLTLNQDITAHGNLSLAASNAAVTQTAGALRASGSTSVAAGAGAITLGGASNDFGTALNLSNSGANAVNISYTGALNLGTVAVGSGALEISAPSIVQSGAITQSGAGAVTLQASSGSIDLNHAGNDFRGAVGLNGTGAVTIRAANDLLLGTSSVGGALTAASSSGSIGQAGALNIGGLASFNFGGTAQDLLLGGAANVFGGGLAINTSGSLRDISLRSAGAFGALPVVAAYSGTLALTQDSGGFSLNNQSFAGGLALTASAGSIALNNVTTGGALSATAPGPLSLGGTITSTGAQTYNGALRLDGNTVLNGQGIEFNGTLNGGTGANHHALTINDGGVTRFKGVVGGIDSLGSLTVSSGGGTWIQTGAITTQGAQTYNSALTLASDTTLSSSAAGVASHGAIDGAHALNINAVGGINVAGAVGGAVAPTALALNGASVALNATINAGSLVTSSATSAGASIDAAWTNNGSLTLTGGGTLRTGGGLTQTGPVDLGAGSTLQLDAAANDSFAAPITGAGGLLKTGSGSTTLLASNAYTGNTVLQAGRLALAVSDAIAASSIAIGAGGTLDLAGFDNTTAGGVSSAGIIVGSGTLTAGGGYTLSGGTVDANLGSGTLTVTGSATLNGSHAGALVEIHNGGSLSLGASERLSDGAALHIAAGGTLDAGSGDETLGSITNAGTLKLSGRVAAQQFAQSGGATQASSTSTGLLAVLGSFSQTGGTISGLEAMHVVQGSGTAVLGTISLLQGLNITAESGGITLGSLSAGGLVAHATGSITQAGGTALSLGSAASLTTSAGNIVLDAAANSFGGPVSLTQLGSGNIAIHSGSALNLGEVASSQGGAVTVTTGGAALNLAGGIAANGSAVSLSAGAVTQNGLITVGSLSIHSSGNVVLSQAGNSIGSLSADAGASLSVTGVQAVGGGGIGAAGDILLKSAAGLNVQANIASSGGNVTLLADDLDIGVGSQVRSAAGSANFVKVSSASAGRAIHLSSLANGGAGASYLLLDGRDLAAFATPTLIVGDSAHTGAILLVGGGEIAAPGVGGTLRVINNGSFAREGNEALVLHGLDITARNGIELAGANRVGSFKASNSGSGNIVFNNGGALSIAGLSNTAAAASSSSGNITIDNGGALNVAGPVAATGMVSLTARGGQLGVAAANISAGGGIGLTAGTGMNIGAGAQLLNTAAAPITLLAQNGHITVDAAASINSGGGPIALTAQGQASKVTAPAGVFSGATPTITQTYDAAAEEAARAAAEAAARAAAEAAAKAAAEAAAKKAAEEAAAKAAAEAAAKKAAEEAAARAAAEAAARKAAEEAAAKAAAEAAAKKAAEEAARKAAEEAARAAAEAAAKAAAEAAAKKKAAEEVSARAAAEEMARRVAEIAAKAAAAADAKDPGAPGPATAGTPPPTTGTPAGSTSRAQVFESQTIGGGDDSFGGSGSSSADAKEDQKDDKKKAVGEKADDKAKQETRKLAVCK
ncbi:filamentous hemagglutinin N-terminal domain-containing protein [Roseateles sp. DAIF2]|uniref:two-partner secretion domain-containing protein n=1 Tax=Roseateles sp. DAIF2 TaxID=2714952 RepID=UPI0018A25EEB|nr:filamentous hemagglutinin N-terminal domain-containing protein [Roseateles sp. DAIF2]QPF71480.1 filamentous hemagglutinin N-terminal domain-containing protein [Roseateles sp. DAIF2]